ncbi:MAG: LytTR family DNA-binding domain-containing protein [Algibacter sp.]
MKKPYTVLVIDDERLARVRLSRMIGKFTETFTIIGEAADVYQAEQLITGLQPDIIFLDIKMPGLTGFELLRKLTKIPMVIFCTAYEDYSLKAFETNSIDYLIKPVKESRLQQTVLKIEQLKTNFSEVQIFKAIENITEAKSKKIITSVAVKKGNKIIFVALDDISHFEATEKYVTLYAKQTSEIIEQSLTQLEEKLPNNFLRIHRGFLINTNYVKEFQKYFNNRYVISLLDHKKTIITSGRTYKEAIKTYINQ